MMPLTRRFGVRATRLWVLVVLASLALGCRPDTAGTARGVEAAADGPVESAAGWPGRVLITNDDGFDDPALLALAQAFAGQAEVYLVAPAVDRSGTSNFMSVVMERRFRAERRDVGDDRIIAYAVDGYPGDCITFALTGPMRTKRPDLVISGINGGPNLGDSWFMSGTVGAARTAAYYEIPAIAVSGVNKKDPTAIAAAVNWVLRLASSEVVRSLAPPHYLTVSLPLLPPEQIRGVRVVRRSDATLSAASRLESSSETASESEVWGFELREEIEQPEPGTDAAAVAAGYIAVVGMRADENDPVLRSRLERGAHRLPSWRVPTPR